MKLSILRHSCGITNLVLALDGKPPTKCPFYFKLFSSHCFTFLGIRIIIGGFK